MKNKIFFPLLKITFWPSFLISTFYIYREVFSSHGNAHLAVLGYLAINVLITVLIIRGWLTTTKRLEELRGSLWLTIYGLVLVPILSFPVIKTLPAMSNLLQDNWYAITSEQQENKPDERYEIIPGEVYGRSSLNAYVSYSTSFWERKIVIESPKGDVSNKYNATAFWSLALPYSLGYMPVGTDSLEHHKITAWSKGWKGGVRKVLYLAAWVPAISFLELVLRSLFSVFPILFLAQVILFITTGKHFIPVTSEDATIVEYRKGAFGTQSKHQALIFRASVILNLQVVQIMWRIGFPFSKLNCLKLVKPLFPKYYERMAWRYAQVYDVVSWALLSELCLYLKEHKLYGPEWRTNLSNIHDFSMGEVEILTEFLRANKDGFERVCREENLCIPPEFVTNIYGGVNGNTQEYVINRLEKILKEKRGDGNMISLDSSNWRVQEILTQSNIHTAGYRPLYLLEVYGQTIDEPISESNHDNLNEKAEVAPKSLKVLLKAMQIKLENKHPNLLISPRWKDFVMFGTVAGCVSLAIRLKDVPEDSRTEIELKMREALLDLFPESERLYADCYHYVTQSLTTTPRSERASNIFILISRWALARASNCKDSEVDAPVVEAMNELYRNETVGFWNFSRE